MLLKKKVGFWALLLVLVMIAGFTSYSYASSDEEDKKSTLPEINREVFVTGTGSFKVDPDTAYLQLGVVTDHVEAGASQIKNAEISKAVVAALETLGIEKKYIRTIHYGIQPMYQYLENRQPEIVGYQTTHNLSIVLRDMDKLGQAIDFAVKAGANRIHQMNFGVFDATEHQMKALEEAVKDARNKASIALGADGEVILQLTQLNISGGFNTQPSEFKRDVMGSSEQSPELMPGQTDITVTVQAVFSF